MNGLSTSPRAQTRRDQTEFVNRHAQLVKRIAFHLKSRLPPSVQTDDLIQAGMIGLLEASRNYDAGQGASFETYAGIRIRGAMLDEIRRSDWAPRSLHRKVRQVSEAIRTIEAVAGRDARDDEIAEHLGVSLDTYHHLLQDAAGQKVFSFEELTGGDEAAADGLCGHTGGPADDLVMEEFREALARLIAGLPERERLVMSLYYDEELNLREIGVVLSVTESRVCQIHGQALLRLKARMRDSGLA
ncbi:MAG: RNA polymerase sigma factor FliA [Gammaproteobacteria bacterium]